MATDTAPNLPAPMNEAQLRSTAASQIDLEIAQSVAPIQSQITSTQNRETKALGQIGGMFDALDPVVKQAAAAVQQSYDQASSQEHAVFAQAQSTLQVLRGNRAADAQELAQKIGGPVAINEWTKPFDDAGSDLAMLGAGQELHTLAYAQAGVQQANQFAGQVFPLVRTEQMSAVRNQFEEQIREYQDQITALKAQKGAQVNKRYNELRTQELEYGLQRAQYQLQKLDSQRSYNLEVKKAKTAKAEADRQYKLDKQQLAHTVHKDANDYQLQKRALGQDDKKIDLLEKELDMKLEQQRIDKGIALGTIDGKPTLASKQLNAQIEHDADLLGLSKQELREKKREFDVNAANAEKQLDAANQTEWVDLLEQAVNPQPGKTYTETVKKEITKEQALGTALKPGIDGAYPEMGKDGKTHYYVNETETHTVPNNFQRITNPNKLVDWLVAGMNDPKYGTEWASKLIKGRFPDLEGWEYKSGGEWPPPEIKKKIKAHGGKDTKIGTEFDPFDLPDWMGPTPLIMQEPKPPEPEKPLNTSVGAKWDKDRDPPVGPPIYGQVKGTAVQKTKSGKYISTTTGKYINYTS